jgi:putative tryptophan/tyrosine transport system substrate-binding protein
MTGVVHYQRRRLLAMLGGGAALVAMPKRARLQTRRATLGWLTVASHPFLEAFRLGMADLGWREGDAFVFNFAYGDGDPGRLPRLADALVQAPVDVIVASGADAVQAARSSTKSLPIIAVTSGDLVGSDFARPVGNVTGIRLRFDEVAVKWIELIAETAPRADPVGVVYDSGPSNQVQFATVQATAMGMGKSILPFKITAASDIAPALQRAQRDGVAALIFTSSPLFTANSALVADLVQRTRLPAIFESRVLVSRGGLMSFGADLRAVFRRLAYFADRILRGARPSELPIEQPTKFELAINLKTAKSLGLEIPRALLVRADEVID